MAFPRKIDNSLILRFLRGKYQTFWSPCLSVPNIRVDGVLSHSCDKWVAWLFLAQLLFRLPDYGTKSQNRCLAFSSITKVFALPQDCRRPVVHPGWLDGPVAYFPAIFSQRLRYASTSSPMTRDVLDSDWAASPFQYLVSSLTSSRRRITIGYRFSTPGRMQDPLLHPAHAVLWISHVPSLRYLPSPAC